MKIKLTIDEENNIAYIYLDEKKKDQIANTVEWNKVNIDMAKDGSIIGIEFLDAKEQLKGMFSQNNPQFVFQNMTRMTKPVQYESA